MHSAGTIASLADAAAQCVEENETDHETKGEKEMSEPKFTPGPWTRDFGQPDWIETPTGSIAIVGIDSKISDQEDSANAALIAVSPEMYGRLREAVIEFCHNCPHRSGDAECKEMDDVCFIQSWVKTLKKARGEA